MKTIDKLIAPFFLAFVLIFTGCGTSQQTTTTIVSSDYANTIDLNTGQYKGYYIGLVEVPNVVVGGYDVVVGSGCYDDRGSFVVLINNKNATNPTYYELVNFLNSDDTEVYDYDLTSNVSFYNGEAEDNVDLNNIKLIIDATIFPSPPKICADFAERLHNNAEIAGIRCGYVIVEGIDHAINVFNTKDKGLVFIDDTGSSSISSDRVAYLAYGKPYGVIDLGCALNWGLDYSGYDSWLNGKIKLEGLLWQYNLPPTTKYTLINPLTSSTTTTTTDTKVALLASINNWRTILGTLWESPGIVADYIIMWDGNWRERIEQSNP
jgi:hypothetical protein